MNMGLARIIKLDQNRYQAVYEHKISDYAIPPFSTIFAHWEIFLADGEVIKSPISSYPYSDNRFKWSVLEQNGIDIYWYRGGKQVGEVVNAAVSQGISAIQEILPGATIEKLEIYVYPDDEAMPTAKGTNSVDRIIGSAAPNSGVMMVALPETADQQSLAAAAHPPRADAYSALPICKGGLHPSACLAERRFGAAVDSYSNPGYSAALKDASDNNQLLADPLTLFILST